MTPYHSWDPVCFLSCRWAVELGSSCGRTWPWPRPRGPRSWGWTGPCPLMPWPSRRSATSSWTWGRCTPLRKRCLCCCACASSSTPSCRTTQVRCEMTVLQHHSLSFFKRIVVCLDTCRILMTVASPVWPVWPPRLLPLFLLPFQGGCTVPMTSCPCWLMWWRSPTCLSWTRRSSTWWSCWTHRCFKERVGGASVCDVFKFKWTCPSRYTTLKPCTKYTVQISHILAFTPSIVRVQLLESAYVVSLAYPPALTVATRKTTNWCFYFSVCVGIKHAGLNLFRREILKCWRECFLLFGRTESSTLWYHLPQRKVCPGGGS